MYHKATAADGHVLDCWIEEPQGAARGGLVILQEIFGVTGQLKALARRYAGLGYRVAIPALFDRQRRGAELGFHEIEAARALMAGAKVDEAMRDTAAAVALLGGRVGVMGFCWGGGLALRAAQTLDVACAIAFYGTRMQGFLDLPLSVPMQGHFGRRDDHTPPEVLAQVQAAFPAFEMHLYDAGHAFANEERPAIYDAAAAELAHARATEFLARHLG